MGTRCATHQRKHDRTRKAEGKRRGSTRAWRKLRGEVIRRDGYRCASCGEAGFGAGLEVHHVNGNHADNNRANLITLCSACHQQQTNAYREEHDQ